MRQKKPGRCRGQRAVEALDGVQYQTGLVGAKNTKRRKELRGGQKGFVAHKINLQTWRIDSKTRKGWRG